MPTLEQIKQYFEAYGIPIPPEFILQLWVDTVGVIQPCLDGAGYPASTQALIYLYLLGLTGYVNVDRQISSQASPSIAPGNAVLAKSVVNVPVTPSGHTMSAVTIASLESRVALTSLNVWL